MAEPDEITDNYRVDRHGQKRDDFSEKRRDIINGYGRPAHKRHQQKPVCVEREIFQQARKKQERNAFQNETKPIGRAERTTVNFACENGIQNAEDFARKHGRHPLSAELIYEDSRKVPRGDEQIEKEITEKSTVQFKFYVRIVAESTCQDKRRV